MKEIIKVKELNNHRIATVFHDAETKRVVIFSHGFRSSSIGPNRFFVRTARQLGEYGISSLRFDQFGSGNSEGEFENSSFNDWVATLETITKKYLSENFRVALFGQSMGAAAALITASHFPELSACVAWVPDPNIEGFVARSSDGFVEEGGQRVSENFWKEAADANVVACIPKISCPLYIVQCTADEYVNAENREAIQNSVLPHHVVETFEGYAHSSWTFAQSEDIIQKSLNFLKTTF